ncbi:SpoIIAA family protein [Marinobacter bohaiensis]|uniref:STAS/SEC14 domain-containing protein n=1 Tax=Marinobacter bohaiensis TaxID=2201898 RepID=UPI000DAE0417|nr:STAS/SEC14 domain-containing protein [Marinobacter bohaiensis]
MDIRRHGLAIGIARVDNQFLLTFKAQGKLTHEDYETITPMIESALAAVEKPRIKVLFDASELEGWGLRAAWDDFNLGLKHGKEFDRIAIFGDRHWQDHVAKIGAWFISGDLKFFKTEAEALAWLNG